MAHSQSVVSHIYYTYFQKHTDVTCACQICTMELNGISINSRLGARRANCSNDMSPHVMLPRRDVRSCVCAAGGTVHMVCRNKDKAEEARADIVKETGNKVQYDSPLNVQ